MACDVPHRRATRVLAEILGKPSLWVIINAPWYYYRRALAVQQAALGPDHPDRADTLDNYADILVMNGRGAEAARLKERAARIRAKAG